MKGAKTLRAKLNSTRYICEIHGKYIRTYRTGEQCPLCVIGKEKPSNEPFKTYDLTQD